MQCFWLKVAIWGENGVVFISEEDLIAAKFFLVYFGGFPLGGSSLGFRRPWFPSLSQNGYFRRRENSSIDCLNVVKESCIDNGCLKR